MKKPTDPVPPQELREIHGKLLKYATRGAVIDLAAALQPSIKEGQALDPNTLDKRLVMEAVRVLFKRQAKVFAREVMEKLYTGPK